MKKLLLIGLLSTNCLAHSLYLSTDNAKQSYAIGERQVDFSGPKASVQLSFDVSEYWSVWGQYASGKDQYSEGKKRTWLFDSESHGLGVSYSFDEWSFSASYSNWDESLVVDHATNPDRVENNRFPSYSFEVSWFTTWQDIVLLSYASLNFDSVEFHRNDPQREVTAEQLIEESNNTTLALTIDASRFLVVAEKLELVLGGSVSWHHILSEDAESFAPNARINNSVRLMGSNSGYSNDSYGRYQLYGLVFLDQNWSLDVAYSRDFARDNTQGVVSAGINYSF